MAVRRLNDDLQELADYIKSNYINDLVLMNWVSVFESGTYNSVFTTTGKVNTIADINKQNIPQNRSRKRRKDKRGAKSEFLLRPKVVLLNPFYRNKCNKHIQQHKKVICVLLNCQSAVKKDGSIGEYLREEKVDFALLTETWYSDDKKDQYEKSYLNTVGYKIDVANRQMQTGGGIAITYRKGINLCKVKNGTTKTFEFSVWKLSFRTMTLHIVGVYRPPSFSPTLFVTEFSEFMEEVLIQYVNPIVMGDFNLHKNCQTYAVSNFNNYVSSMGLKQHVTFPTHEKSGKSLDFIITEVSDGVKVLKCEPGPFFSDHCVVKMDFNVIKETKLSKNDFFRNWTEFGQSQFLKDLVNLSVHCEDVDTFIRTLEYLTGKMIDKEAAMKKKMKICRASKPCFRQNIKQSIHRSERLRGGYKLPQFQEFKRVRNQFSFEINRMTVDSIVDKARGNSKKLHSLVAELIGSQSENTIPFLENERASVEKLTDHFINTIPTIQQMLKDFQNFKPQVEDGPNIDLFKDFTEEEISVL